MPLSTFVTGVLGTEQFSYSKSFSKEISFNDKHHSSDTVICASNSDFGFTGPVLQLRNKYRNRVDYSSGYVSIHTTQRRREGKRSIYSKFQSNEVQENVALLDLHTFKEFFADPKALAEFLLSRAKVLVSTWMAKNAGPDMVGRRAPVGYSYELVSFPWVGSKNRAEKSTYVMQMSSYGYTALVQQHSSPKMTLNDIKCLIKLASTLNNQGPSQTQGGCRFDGYGYGAPFLHFVGLLKSDRFAAYVKDLIETDPGPSGSNNGGGGGVGEDDDDEEGIAEEEEAEKVPESGASAGVTPGSGAKRQKLSDNLEEGELIPNEEEEEEEQGV